MTTFAGTGGNGSSGTSEEGRGIGQRVDQLGQDAQQLLDEARGAVHQIGSSLDLRGRVDRNPYGMVLAAAGVGYLLGGGLFTPLTARMVRLAVRLAALPFVKDELLGMAEEAVDGFVRSAQAGQQGPQTPGTTT